MTTTWGKRPLGPGDQTFLWEMLYIALWDAPGDPRRPRSVLEKPEIRRLVEHWGRPGDVGFVAVGPASSSDVGAVWTRLDRSDQLEDFGCRFPRIGIAVHADYRHRGVGSFPMASLIDGLENTVDGLRWGVHPENRNARRLYEKFGFEEYAVGHGNYPQTKLALGTAGPANRDNPWNADRQNMTLGAGGFKNPRGARDKRSEARPTSTS